jgi:hypothetical protein
MATKIHDHYKPAPGAIPAPADGAPIGSTIYHQVDGVPGITVVGNPVPFVMTPERLAQVKANTSGKNAFGWEKKK